MKLFILLLSTLITIEARNIPSGLEVYEILQDQTGSINIKPVSSNTNLKYKRSKSKIQEDVNLTELLKYILSQSKQSEEDSRHVEDVLPLEESLFVDETKSMIPRNNIVLHLLAPKKLLKNKNNLRGSGFPPILRYRVEDRTLAPQEHKDIYVEDD